MKWLSTCCRAAAVADYSRVQHHGELPYNRPACWQTGQFSPGSITCLTPCLGLRELAVSTLAHMSDTEVRIYKIKQESKKTREKKKNSTNKAIPIILSCFPNLFLFTWSLSWSSSFLSFFLVLVFFYKFSPTGNFLCNALIRWSTVTQLTCPASKPMAGMNREDLALVSSLPVLFSTKLLLAKKSWPRIGYCSDPITIDCVV